jgi:putative DNA topoisomerase
MKKIIVIVFALFAASTTFAQKDKMQKPDSTASVKLEYSCPMHPEVTSDKPGKCTKCGMELTLSKKEHMKTAVTGKYSCPMHADVVSNKAGKCPKCGMDLKKRL